MAGDYEANFPSLEDPSLHSRAGNGVSSSVRASIERVDIVQLLKNASIPTSDHLRIDSSDGPAARQIKELTAKLKKLRGDLEDKENLLKASRVLPSDANSGLERIERLLRQGPGILGEG
ncbi:uncharacterized protein LOC131310763 [Rhododendron vialii]|uniref:uncharacterized protein LOC131310763 n=1 Tax=Rhododendron vialii TaxID=182163 RepID=UPI00265EA5F1|nr:uncharacterized protein LOC131310763 [Rhododendron vialii]